MDKRTYCEQCGTYRFKDSPEERCWHCKPAAEKRAILAAKAEAKLVTFTSNRLGHVTVPDAEPKGAA